MKVSILSTHKALDIIAGIVLVKLGIRMLVADVMVNAVQVMGVNARHAMHWTLR